MNIHRLPISTLPLPPHCTASPAVHNPHQWDIVTKMKQIDVIIIQSAQVPLGSLLVLFLLWAGQMCNNMSTISVLQGRVSSLP